MARPTVSTTFNATDRVTGTVKKMNKSVSGFSRKSKRSFKGVGNSMQTLRRVMTGAVAVLATGKIAQSIGKFAKTGDEIAKTARKLGISTTSLQELQKVSENFGVDSEALRDGLKELTLRADEFAVTGAGPAAEAMERLGLSQEEINKNKGNTEELFNMMLDKMSSIKDTAARQRIADELFGGTGGEQLVEMLSLTSDEMDNLREKVEGVRSAQNIRASEQFTESMRRLRNVMENLRNKALTPLIEKFTPLINKTATWISQNKEMIQLRIEQVFEGIRKVVKIIVRLWNSGLLPAIIAGVAAFKAITLAMSIYQTVLAVAKAAQIAFNVAMAANPIGLIIIAIAALVAAIIWLVKNWDTVKAKLKEWWEAIKEWTKLGVDKVTGWFNNMVDWIKLGFDKIKNGWQAVKDFFIRIWEQIKKPFKAIGDFFSRIFGKKHKVDVEYNESGSGGASRLIGRNDGVMESRSVSESHSTVGINIAGLPPGSSVQQKGKAPGVGLNYAFGGSGL